MKGQLFALFAGLVCLSVSAGKMLGQPNGPAVFTDKPDYQPGETVLITGIGFQPGEAVRLQVVNLTDPSDNGPEHDPWQVTADTAGGFQTTWITTWSELDCTLLLTAEGLTSGLQAQTTFTDAANVNSITVSNQVGTLTYGAAGNVTFGVRALGTGQGTVTFSVVSGLPTPSGTNFNPNPVSGNGSWSTTLTFYSSNSTPAGTYTFIVRATGNNSKDGTNTLTINKANTTTSVASSENPSLPGQSVTFTATVNPQYSGTPGGSVQFKTNGAALGAPVVLSNGVAEISLATLPHGSNIIVAEYLGDGNFNGSTNSRIQVVNTPPAAGTRFLGATLNTALNVSAGTLASLDYDADGDPLTITAVSSTSTNGGSVALNSGTITYTPPNNYVGQDMFTYAIRDNFGGTNLCKAIVTVRLGKATSTFNYISPPSNGRVDLRGYGIPARSYDVQVSTNLLNWETLDTVTAAANGVILYTDTNATSSPRYYRFAVH